jgi:hypothetical protein
MMLGACSSHVTIYIERIGLNEVAPEGTLREGILHGLFGTCLCFFRLLSLSLSLFDGASDRRASFSYEAVAMRYFLLIFALDLSLVTHQGRGTSGKTRETSKRT